VPVDAQPDTPALAPPAAVAVSGPTAIELFSAASRARVRGELDEAIRLSRELADRFPASPEAATVHLSLGMLYLQAGQPQRALDEFRSGPSAHRPAEALWGESQALRRLGRIAEERAVLETLLERYPRAAYVAAARKRLDASR
jgi:TolA-binding protein